VSISAALPLEAACPSNHSEL